MHLHELKNGKESLNPMIKKIYIPKYSVKRYSPYLYSNEKATDYLNLRYF